MERASAATCSCSSRSPSTLHAPTALLLAAHSPLLGNALACRPCRFGLSRWVCRFGLCPPAPFSRRLLFHLLLVVLLVLLSIATLAVLTVLVRSVCFLCRLI
jgi:hypothetical protein